MSLDLLYLWYTYSTLEYIEIDPVHVVGIMRRSVPRLLVAARRSHPPPLADIPSPPPLHRHGSLLLVSRGGSGPASGMLGSVSDAILRHGCQVVGADLHVEQGGGDGGSGGGTDGTHVCRISFDGPPPSFDLTAFEADLAGVASSHRAEARLLHRSGRLVAFPGRSDGREDHAHGDAHGAPRTVLRPYGPARMGVLASGRDHCLSDLMGRCRGGDLPAEISYVISNHPRRDVKGGDEEGRRGHVRRSLAGMGVPYHHLRCGGGRAREDWEGDLQSLVSTEDGQDQGQDQDRCKRRPTDFLVLARFMRILSPKFLAWYGPRPIINIHHGLLPSFKGSNPYRQAHDAGVKLVGATAHFVTEELDEGPIIEQRVARIGHGSTVRDLRIRSETLEANALHDAVRYYAENRVARVGGRTVVFTT